MLIVEFAMISKSRKHELAAELIAADDLPDYEIARLLQISKRTLEYWKARPEFKERVEHIVKVYARFCTRQIDAEFAPILPQLSAI